MGLVLRRNFKNARINVYDDQGRSFSISLAASQPAGANGDVNLVFDGPDFFRFYRAEADPYPAPRKRGISTGKP